MTDARCAAHDRETGRLGAARPPAHQATADQGPSGSQADTRGGSPSVRSESRLYGSSMHELTILKITVALVYSR